MLFCFSILILAIMKDDEVIIIDRSKVLELERIIMDKDKDGAFEFLNEHLYRLIKKRRETHCRGPFTG